MELEGIVLGVYLLLLGVFTLISLRYLYHVLSFYTLLKGWRLKRPRLRRYPKVCVQLPVFNEPFVVERVIRATAQLDWPKDKLEIQVLDDSTDETPLIASKVVEELKREGFDIKHVRRKGREGFKAGALAYGMRLSDADYFAIFDADFIPPKDFLKKTVPFLEEDPKLAGVQTRWGFLNEESSVFTMAQAFMLNLHFVVEQFVRSRTGMWMTFNGTAGILKRSALEWVGGWETDTLTEDSDLSIRLYSKGYRILYLPDVVCFSELPDSILAFKSQQKRWAKGGVQVAKKYWKRILSLDWPISWKVEVFMQTLGNFGYPLGVVLLLLLPYILYLKFTGRYEMLYTVMGGFAVFSILAVWVAFGVAYSFIKRDWKTLFFIPIGMAIVGGLMINNTNAVLEGIFGEGGVFERTPKAGERGRLKLKGISKSLRLAKMEVWFGTYLLVLIVVSTFLNQMILALTVAVSAFGLMWLGTSSVIRISQEIPESIWEWRESLL